MDWYLVVPSTTGEGTWLDLFAPAGTKHNVIHVSPAVVTVSTRKSTNLSQWRQYFEHAGRAWRLASKHRPRAGLITCFPQTALASGVYKRLARRRDVPVVAWNFNFGKRPSARAARLSRTAWSAVDCFVVHSRHEAKTYAQWFGIPEDRFEFVALPAPTRTVSVVDAKDNFVVAMGAAQRDYATLLAALASLHVPTTIVAPPHAVQGMTIPPHVTLRSGLDRQTCFDLLASSRFQVLPLAPTESASGHVTLVEAMRLGTPTIATRAPGLVDYATHGEEVLFVEQGDVDGMRAAIAKLWHDDALRTSLAHRARERADRDFSDEAAAASLYRILDRLESRG